MKALFTIISLSLIGFFTQAQERFTISYAFNKPILNMKDHLNQIHGLNIALEKRIKNTGLYLGAEISANFYGIKTVEQTLPFGTGYVTTTDVNYTDMVNQYGGRIRYEFMPNAKFTPYLSGRLGLLHYFSKMTIQDPNDADGCEPLDSRLNHMAFTYAGGVGAGFVLSGSLFGKKCNDDFKIDFGVSLNRGGRATYLQSQKFHNHNSTAPTTPPSGTKYVTAQFRHRPSGTVHEHPLGTLHTSTFNTLQFQLGVSIPLD
jgi:hypothetical protein